MLEKETLQCLALLAHTHDVALSTETFEQLLRMDGFLDHLAAVMEGHDASRFVLPLLDRFVQRAAAHSGELIDVIRVLPLSADLVRAGLRSARAMAMGLADGRVASSPVLMRA